ncbi:hypothetical protein HCB32_09270 [Listeria booriae]|uniref:hypothetical protein n=1 Tax=Listeria booriae TaxID=1552123 RepID=UPI00162732C1|nr:hypothetical protein [Listeria booriae]MBC2195270.1 hypothetical protein [Listeria booriae]
MKKGLSRLLLVMIAIAMIVSTIPAYEPYAEQGGARAEATVEGTSEQPTVVEGKTSEEQPVEQEVPPAETTVEGVTEQPEVVEKQQETQVSIVKEDGDWVDPYYEGKRMLRGVQDKPEKATIKTVSNGVGTGTGAMNLSWKAMTGATGYKVIIGNGYNYEYFSVGNVTSWTTKGKGIFPTKAELDKGLYRFHTDGKGTEFANDPTQLYENTFKAGTTWTLRGQKKYIVRILAIYTSGDGPTSDITEAVMPPETLPAKPEKSVIKTTSNGAGTGTGYMDISWKAVSGAIDYKVVISNGYNYEYFNTGNVTNWSTKGKGIFPTQAEIANKQYKFHQDSKGAEFASDPRALYENGYQAGSTFGLRDQTKYIVRVLAVYPWGDGLSSDITDAYMPEEPTMPKPEKAIIKTLSNGPNTGTGYMDISWGSMEGAIGYKVIIGNGFNYEHFSVGNVTNWTTKGKNIFPTEEEIKEGNYKFHRDGKGVEFANNPRDLYENGFQAGSTFGLRDQEKYIVRVAAIYPVGGGPTSDITDAYMPLETSNPPRGTVYANDGNANTGFVNLRWDIIDGADGYEVGVFNGATYTWYDVGDAISWTTRNKGIWPTMEEIQSGKSMLHKDGLGSELVKDPSQVYKNSGGPYPTNTNYWFRVRSYVNESNRSNSAISETFRPVVPNAEVSVMNSQGNVNYGAGLIVRNKAIYQNSPGNVVGSAWKADSDEYLNHYFYADKEATVDGKVTWVHLKSMEGEEIGWIEKAAIFVLKTDTVNKVKQFLQNNSNYDSYFKGILADTDVSNDLDVLIVQTMEELIKLDELNAEELAKQEAIANQLLEEPALDIPVASGVMPFFSADSALALTAYFHGIEIVRNRGHYKTAEYMEHAIKPPFSWWGWKPDKHVTKNDRFAKSSRDDKEFFFAVNQAFEREVLSKGKTNASVTSSFTFKSGELHSALNKVQYTATFKKRKNGTYKVQVVLKDVYDFAWSTNYKDFGVNFGNNYCVLATKIGIIKPYKIEVIHDIQ